jgi:hypothetical protein
MQKVEVARRLSLAPRRAPGAARAATSGRSSVGLCLGLGSSWPHGRARSLHVLPRPSSLERAPSHAMVTRLGAIPHARRFQSVSLGWGPSRGRRGEAWRALARAHRLRGTWRGTEDRGEQGRREHECGAGARHGDARRGSRHVCCW